MLHAQLFALALLTLALASAGCGESTTKTTTVIVTPPRKPLTRAEKAQLARASAICKRIDARHSSLKLNTRPAIVRELPRFASYQRAALAELIKLTPPASIAHDWREFTAAAQTLASDTTRLATMSRPSSSRPPRGILATVGKDERYISDLASLDAINGCKQVY